jgi:hypothetical protein
VRDHASIDARGLTGVISVKVIESAEAADFSAGAVRCPESKELSYE